MEDIFLITGSKFIGKLRIWEKKFLMWYRPYFFQVGKGGAQTGVVVIHLNPNIIIAVLLD